MNEALVKAVQRGEAQPVELWLQMEKFIRSIAHKYRNRADMEDLMQESYFGLLSAIRLYDPDKGSNFLSYSHYWIEQAMLRYIRNNRGTIRVPENAAGRVYRYRRMITAFRRDVGRSPTGQEIGAALGLSSEQVAQVAADDVMMDVGSLNSLIADSDGLTISDTMQDTDVDVEAQVLDKVQAEELKAELWDCVDTLPERQAKTIRKRYQDGQTQQEVAESLGVTCSRVGAIEADALRRLRSEEIRKRLEPYLDDIRYSRGLRQGHDPTAKAALKAEEYLARLRNDGLI